MDPCKWLRFDQWCTTVGATVPANRAVSHHVLQRPEAGGEELHCTRFIVRRAGPRARDFNGHWRP
eukprot:172140-Heterocapsa_arctica.AAC.1